MKDKKMKKTDKDMKNTKTCAAKKATKVAKCEEVK